MGFWIFMLVMGLVIPITMIAFGKLFIKKVPNNINSVFGYRSSMSMKNKDTWIFAHRYCGKIWYVGGLILLPLSVIPLLFVIGNDADTIGTVGGIVSGVQLLPLVGAIIPTEIALRKKFDHLGRKR